MVDNSATSNNNMENQNQKDINELFLEETNNNDDDVFWSMFSNAFFIGGGFFYIVGSTWDLSLSKSSNEVDHGDDTLPQNMILYYLVWTLGPIVYLLNSAIDVTWAMRTMAIERKRRGMFET